MALKWTRQSGTHERGRALVDLNLATYVTGQPTVAGNQTLSYSTHRNIYWKSARTVEKLVTRKHGEENARPRKESCKCMGVNCEVVSVR